LLASTTNYSDQLLENEQLHQEVWQAKEVVQLQMKGPHN